MCCFSVVDTSTIKRLERSLVYFLNVLFLGSSNVNNQTTGTELGILFGDQHSTTVVASIFIILRVFTTSISDGSKFLFLGCNNDDNQTTATELGVVIISDGNTIS
jgi:hypothetical protein